MIPTQNTNKVVLNGQRPSPLKLHKQYSSSNSSSSSISKQTRKRPVIIYDHSPKIIHTKPTDFMSLVQKLTGHSHDRAAALQDDDEVQSPIYKKMRREQLVEEVTYDRKERDGSTTSSLDIDSSVSPMLKMPMNPYFADIPLFTPNYLADYLCSPRSLFRSPKFGNSFSPSFMEVMKGLKVFPSVD